MNDDQRLHEERLATYDTLTRRADELAKGVAESGQLALKSAILLNGGAAVAIMALLSNMSVDAQQRESVLVFMQSAKQFTNGALLGVIATAFAYGTNYAYYIDYEKRSDHVIKTGTQRHKTAWVYVGGIMHVIVALLVLISYGFFYFGVELANRGFSIKL